MANHEPLKKGQEVFLRRPMQVYATVIGPRDSGPLDGTEVYCVRLQAQVQYYQLQDLELSDRPTLQPKGPLDISERLLEINRLITLRAYELFESHGSTHGHDRDDWMRAQSEILHDVPVDIRETENELTIRAEVPGFSEEHLEVRVAPRSVCIAGNRQEIAEQHEGNIVYSERRSDQIFRVLELPSQVEPQTVDLALGGGILEIKVAKATPANATAPLARGAAA